MSLIRMGEAMATFSVQAGGRVWQIQAEPIFTEVGFTQKVLTGIKAETSEGFPVLKALGSDDFWISTVGGDVPFQCPELTAYLETLGVMR